ncbi:hypothetical protein D9611_010372 [Ephemerocybe angulata]|uniref:Magnesium-dependent phosphatase-1 n=1 Tax=Ephemerocybe angulata TaxID=980116 RepID=A0A8H5BB91_9AGAR|nr:hypothetical protein D9611_010372 [Tulosesus angulatus]
MATEGPFPKLVAFDLDYTLWDLWIDTHVDGPLHRNGETVNQVLDRNNQPIRFYRDVPDILHTIRAWRIEDREEGDNKVVIAACSRTSAPALARQCLNLLLVPPPSHVSGEGVESKPVVAAKFFDEMEIYPGSKLTHFKKIHQRTGIPYEEMLFFDDERRNGEVEKLGVTFIHVPIGLNRKVFDDGVKHWRKKRSETA